MEQASSASKSEEATKSTTLKETPVLYASTLDKLPNPSGLLSHKPLTRPSWQTSGLSGTIQTTPGLDQIPQNTTGQRHHCHHHQKHLLLNNSQKSSPTSLLWYSSLANQENLDGTTGLTSTLDYTGSSANTRPTAHTTTNKLMTSSPSYLSTTRPKRNDSPRPPLTLFERIGPPVDPENISRPVSPSPLPIPPRVFTPIRGLIRTTENTPDPLIPLSNPAPSGNVDDIASTYSFEPPEDWMDHFPSGPDRVDLVKTLLAHILEWWKQKGIPNQTSATEQAVVENARWYLEAEKGDIDPETENFKAVERVCHYYSDLLGDALLPIAPEQPPSLQARIHTPEASPTPSSESSVISVKTTESDRDMEKPTGWGWFEYDATNPTHYSFRYINDQGQEEQARYIRYARSGIDTFIEGSRGRNYPVYGEHLHGAPRGEPNFDIHKGPNDRDHTIFISDLARDDVNWALDQLRDVGATADVRRYRGLKAIEAEIARAEMDLATRKIKNLHSIQQVQRYLTKSTLRTRLHPYLLQAPIRSTTSQVPRIEAGQGPPIEKQDHWCPRCERFEYGIFRCDQGGCTYCKGGHNDDECILPHISCGQDLCRVPVHHINHGLVCPEFIFGQVNNNRVEENYIYDSD